MDHVFSLACLCLYFSCLEGVSCLLMVSVVQNIFGKSSVTVLYKIYKKVKTIFFLNSMQNINKIVVFVYSLVVDFWLYKIRFLNYKTKGTHLEHIVYIDWNPAKILLVNKSHTQCSLCLPTFIIKLWWVIKCFGKIQ